MTAEAAADAKGERAGSEDSGGDNGGNDGWDGLGEKGVAKRNEANLKWHSSLFVSHSDFSSECPTVKRCKICIWVPGRLGGF